MNTPEKKYTRIEIDLYVACEAIAATKKQSTETIINDALRSGMKRKGWLFEIPKGEKTQ